jgi:hypothetical protein
MRRARGVALAPRGTRRAQVGQGTVGAAAGAEEEAPPPPPPPPPLLLAASSSAAAAAAAATASEKVVSSCVLQPLRGERRRVRRGRGSASTSAAGRVARQVGHRAHRACTARACARAPCAQGTHRACWQAPGGGAEEGAERAPAQAVQGGRMEMPSSSPEAEGLGEAEAPCERRALSTEMISHSESSSTTMDIARNDSARRAREEVSKSASAGGVAHTRAPHPPAHFAPLHKLAWA